MPNPFDVDDDDKTTDKLVEQVREKAQAAEEPGNIEMDIEAPDDEEDEQVAGPQGGIHQQKKRERVARFKEERDQAAAEVERLRLENTRLEAARVAAETAARVTQRSTPEPDPFDSKLKRVEEAKANLYTAYKAKETAYAQAKQAFPADELESYRRQAKELNEEEENLRLDRRDAKRGAAQPQTNPEIAAVTAWLNMEHPDVMKNADARRYAILRYETLKAEGHPESKDTVNLAMSQARQRYGMAGAKRPAPTQQSRAMYSGASTARGAKRTEDSGNGKIVMTPQMQAIAVQTFSKLAKEKGDEAAIKHWARTVGPSYQAQRARSERKRA